MRDLPFADYAELGGVNWSRLKHLRESPLKYRHICDHPEDDPETTGRLRGQLLHALVFGTLDRDFAVYEGDRRGTNEYKAFVAANPGKAILKASEVDDVRRQADAAKAHPALRPYLDGGEYELTLRWRDVSGLTCKGRVDLWHPRTGTLIDLKGSSTIAAERFGRLAASAGYPCQLAHYARGIAALTGEAPRKLAIFAVESKPPYDGGLFVLDDIAERDARDQLTALLERLRECQERDEWPGQHPTETPLWTFNDNVLIETNTTGEDY